ncbi:uncharacterized protein fid [Chelonus insularis]|uniref:uncharacterized protein fid n=1 Tax=Chelonus insularis TaxID=460826 RepID=UPI00158BC431|nr:uncharacterized protein LOC118072872 [Chelonus insularis]XP_034948914.1 uncharacterized protein LOC118072872 [Chelonus insularis]
MSESEGEATARSVALEQAYVHEVYEQCAGKTTQSRHWPRIYKFLEELEPGALVCDIGCGNGKYLNINNSIFKIGADRCKRLTSIAREKQNEVLLCDNLALPFRDESFDAVLSIAVVHHFATTERRVNALKELARVLRIGGKLVISVWAMEQKHRKFESQDVLIPWPKAYCLNSTCNCGSKFPCIDSHRDQPSQKCILKSKTNWQKCKSRRYWIDPIFSPSPSTSSLSSPNETCYSFFRRALQKLAGGKRHSGNRSWFLESLHGGGYKNQHQHFDPDDNSDVDDIPIELRRLEDEHLIINKGNDSLSIKSKSLGDIVEIQRTDIVRSRSSIPGLCSTVTTEVECEDKSDINELLVTSKPQLTKKMSQEDKEHLEEGSDTAIRELMNDLTELGISSNLSKKRGNVCKQSSMNEELMSMERLVERESVRRNIMKQASLNEEMLRENHMFENLKDSISSSATTRRFQLLKSGLTNRIKQSTTSLEKVASISIKNGFVKILQSWKSDLQYNNTTNNSDNQDDQVFEDSKLKVEKLSSTVTKKEPETERRLSREDGSDSSKDSSLQSDASVDSEDSFVSVIYVPKKDIPPIDMMPTTSGHEQLRTTSAPPSPRIKYPPDLHGPRFKLISISPLLKQFPATSKSLPPPSPPGLSPRTLNSFNSRLSFNSQIPSLSYSFDHPTNVPPVKPEPVTPPPEIDSQTNNDTQTTDKPVEPENVEKIEDKVEDHPPEPITTKPPIACSPSTASLVVDKNVKSTKNSTPKLSSNKLVEKSKNDSTEDEDSRKTRLNQIKELLKQKPGFATRYSKPAFPLVRRASTATVGRLETVAKTLPRLLSLELFNPETDDLDSDSSGVSSPESGDSVISVISDEKFIVKKNGTLVPESEVRKSNGKNTKNNTVPNENNEIPTSSQSSKLLEAAANVASSLENAVDQVIKTRSDSDSLHEVSKQPENVVQSFIENQKQHGNSVDDKTWNEECKRDLIDFTDKLSENLINDIDQYCQRKRLELNNDLDFMLNDKITDVSMNSKNIEISNCKYNALVDNTIAWLQNSTGNQNLSEYDNKLTLNSKINNEVTREESDDMDFVIVSNTGEIEENKKSMKFNTNNSSLDSSDSKSNLNNTLKINNDSDTSHKSCSSSNTLFESANVMYNKNLKEKRSHEFGQRSVSEETTEAVHDNRFDEFKSHNFSESSSQESLPSDREGGAVKYHQYYHVFREGELDQLINKYVENLHIISSYYDHANWCIVAEKVQVWTI